MALVVAVLWLFGFLLLWRVPRARAAARRPSRTVCVVIPARNEEHNLPRLLSSPDLATVASQLIVVDDHSQDATAAIARDGGAVVVASDPLPPGWLGKTWACWQGVRRVDGETLVFLDADTTLEPGGLGRALAELDRTGGLVSLWPYHQMERFYERLAAYFNIVIMTSMDVFGILGRWMRPKGAFGPMMVCRRSDYDAVGGHRAVRGDILDDVALGQAFQRHGLGVALFGGRGVVRFRMYPEGLRSLLTGFSKNMGSGLAAGSPLTTCLFIGWLTGGYITTWYLIASLLPVESGLLVAWAAVYFGFVLQLHWMLTRLGNYTVFTALLFPIPLVFFSLVALGSVFMTFVRGRVGWKGRVVDVRALRQQPDNGRDEKGDA